MSPPQPNHGFPTDPYAESVDPTVSCSRCDAVCCRLTVVLMPEDRLRVPVQYVEQTPQGYEQLARGEDGWCLAIDENHMKCTIYENRPSACRRFAMGGPYCRAEREDYYERGSKDIPFLLRS
jgi:Fe-S-cluster containining protein